jgi:hypothetical protein
MSRASLSGDARRPTGWQNCGGKMTKHSMNERWRKTTAAALLSAALLIGVTGCWDGQGVKHGGGRTYPFKASEHDDPKNVSELNAASGLQPRTTAEDQLQVPIHTTMDGTEPADPQHQLGGARVVTQPPNIADPEPPAAPATPQP